MAHVRLVRCYDKKLGKTNWRGYIIACVAWRFWLLSNKGGRGQKNREEIGAGATEKPPYLIFSGQQHNLQLLLTLEIARWTLAGFFGVSPFAAIEKDERAWGLFWFLTKRATLSFEVSYYYQAYDWLGKLKPDKLSPRVSKWGEGGGSQKPLESGQAVFIFLAASPLVRPARQNRRATQARYIMLLAIFLNSWYVSVHQLNSKISKITGSSFVI